MSWRIAPSVDGCFWRITPSVDGCFTLSHAHIFEIYPQNFSGEQRMANKEFCRWAKNGRNSPSVWNLLGKNRQCPCALIRAALDLKLPAFVKRTTKNISQDSLDCALLVSHVSSVHYWLFAHFLSKMPAQLEVDYACATKN